MLTLIETLVEPQVLIAILVAISAFASVITLAMPFMSSDKLQSRLKHVSTERDVLRARHRALLEEGKGQTKLREQNTGYMQQAVRQFNLSRLLETKDTRDRLKMAGLRAQKHVITFLFFRAILPFAAAGATFVYLYVTGGLGLPPIKSRGCRVVRCVYRVLSAQYFCDQHDQEAPVVDQARVSGRSGSASDMC